MAVRVKTNAQGETQLLFEWLSTLPPDYKWSYHVFVGRVPLDTGGVPLSPARARALAATDRWVDARVATPHEVWVVEAKLKGVDAAYGQAYGYSRSYAHSLDYVDFAPRLIVPVVLVAARIPEVEMAFEPLGIRTIQFPVSWLGDGLIKLYQALDPH
jgi:hypothetical protein